MMLHDILYVLMLIFIFQYHCCVLYQIEADHVAHIMTHYLKITVADLRNDIDVFAKSNMKWIRKVGATFFRNLDADVYIKELVQGVHNFDAMAILLACVSHNIHALVLLQKLYWSTRGENGFHNCAIKLAHLGGDAFKFIVPSVLPLPPTAEVDANKEDDLDLEGTILLVNEPDNGSDAFDFSDNDKDNGSQASDAIDSREGDFTDDEDAEIGVNASQASGIESVEKETLDKDHDDAVKENGVNASQDSVETPDKDHDDSVKENGVNASQDSVETPDKDDDAANGSQASIDSVETLDTWMLMTAMKVRTVTSFLLVSVFPTNHIHLLSEELTDRDLTSVICVDLLPKCRLLSWIISQKRIQVLSTSVIIVVLCLKVAMACSSMNGHINTFVISVIYVVKGLSFRIK